MLRSMGRDLRELVRYRTLVNYLVLLDLRLRYRGSVLGFLWTLLNPLLLMLVMWAVFSRFARIEEKSYALFLFSGLMIWLFFSQSVERALGTIIGNRGLIQRVYLPKIVFPFSVVTSNLVNLLFFLAAYVLMALAILRELPLTALLLPAVLAMLFVLSVGAALLMSTLNVFFRDFSHLTSVLLRALFYLTPIFYKPDMLGEKLGFLLRLNPVYYPVVMTRELLYYGTVPSMELWAVSSSMAAGVFLVGLAAFIGSQEKFVYYA